MSASGQRPCCPSHGRGHHLPGRSTSIRALWRTAWLHESACWAVAVERWARRGGTRRRKGCFDPFVRYWTHLDLASAWSSHESHRRGLELQRATVRGAPSLRSSVHPPATLECEQRRRPVMLLWLEGFSTILAALAMLLLRPASRCQVLLPLTARPACTQPSLTAGCAPCAVGACQPLPFNHHTTRATRLGSATTCSRAAACLVHHVHRGGAPAVLTAPCPRSGGC